MEDASYLNIIIVDDDPDDHYLNRKAIKSSDSHHTVEHVYSGNQLMEMLLENNNTPKKNLPDIIFLDLNMPGIDGYDVLSKISSHSELKKIAIYILSSSPYEKDILKWKEMGVTDFFMKPYQFDKLKKIFGEIIAKHVSVKSG